MKTVLALRHTPFEDLGVFEPQFRKMGFAVRYLDVGVQPLCAESPLDADIAVVLGGPVSARDIPRYPYLGEEIAWLRARLIDDMPTLGIALGAHLIAIALGAGIQPGAGDIGWTTLAAGADACAGYLRPLLEPGIRVMQWHADRFGLPPNARHLAASAHNPDQAFAWGRNCLALQFHPELDAAKIERWLIAGGPEIARMPGFDIARFRSDSERYGPPLRKAAQEFLFRWIRQLDSDPRHSMTAAAAGIDRLASLP
ncbi:MULTISPECIES: glutamine amidotransferase [unclassified Herbaspirillum]|uniref:glutamine amidotransferase-related protein n=1 Tax=unclassified Herbaspirillum TaxID=2624150 RepID=UPI00114FBDD2|nr:MULTISPECIES: glutamine amidotransferase [unclassified Herbaspirillum]MBB5391515.1 GMP synthase (glutamine-hydrolyzing) [Herbaspirillum sp. SJZ102]TQK12802.1 GMP synthase (glutamine-hydrolysing) [Herbaspirillum sp. SJZ130]TQK14806.1 GMP synthase (glutamine-hydrolysing) [Herbaspirillum sp. SJZ106]